MPDQNVATAVALVVQVHTEALNQVEVTSVHRDIVSVALGDDRSGVKLLGPLRDVHRLVVEADRQLARLTMRDHY
jgi:hypothetical protein